MNKNFNLLHYEYSVIHKRIDTDQYSVVMKIYVEDKKNDYGQNEGGITIHITQHDIVNKTVCGKEYPASEFVAALDDFEKIKKMFEKKYNKVGD